MINKGVGTVGKRALALLGCAAILALALPLAQPTAVKAGAADLENCSGSFIAYWQLGNNYEDCAPGEKNNASVPAGRSAPSPAAGRVGGAQQFTAGSDASSSDGLSAPATPDFDFSATDSFSFEMWVRIPTSGCQGSNKVFIGRSSTNTTDRVAWWVGCQGGTGNPVFSVRSAGVLNATQVIGPATIADGNFHHIAAVRSAAANALILYVDGNEVNRVAYTTSTGFATGTPVTLGWYENSSFTFSFTGILDEVAAYRTALDAGTVQAHATSGEPYSVDTGSLDQKVYMPLILK